MSEIDEDVVIVTEDQVRAAIDAEARARMSISGEEFIRRWQLFDLSDTAAVSDIGILVRLLDVRGGYRRS